MLICLSSISSAKDLSIHGFIQGNYSIGTKNAPGGSNLKWAEERAQIKLEYNKVPLYLFFKSDLSYDHIDRDLDTEIREAYVDYTASMWDLRLGRQVITWGVGDLVFINDVFPKDYEAFFSGRPMEYLKKGVDAIHLGLYPEALSLEVVIIPFFTPDDYPRRSRFWMYNPVPGVSDRTEEEPSATLHDTEVAIRAYRDIKGVDLSVYLYRGFFRKPSMIPDNPSNTTAVSLIYPELSVYGVSLQWSTIGGVFSLEAGFYDSRQDRQGTDPFIPNQSSRFLIGYERQLREDFTLGLQYYASYMYDYHRYVRHLPYGFHRQGRWHDILTLRLVHLFMHQDLRLSFFSFLGISDGDYMLRPELRYRLTDSLWVSGGANIFGGGREWSEFGSMDKDDNIYLLTRYEF